MKLFFTLIAIFLTLKSFSQIDITNFSEEFLLKVKMEESIESDLHTLENFSLEKLINQLNTDDKKKAFWLNIYNAFIQIKAKEFPNLIYEKRNAFFVLAL